jgi:hypothetical protein
MTSERNGDLPPVDLPAGLERAALGSNRSEFPNQRDFDSTCWLGGGQQEMAKPYSQDLRDRVIDAVKRGDMSAAQQRAATRSANLWLSNGLSELNGMAHESLSDTAAIAPPS